MIPMVLVDTSIWVTHFREGHQRLEKLLTEAMVLCHLFIVGELACGPLQNRREILHLLQSLPMAPVVEFEAVLFFIERRGLMGRGVGYVDVHLLAAAQLAGTSLWTADRRLKSTAAELGSGGCGYTRIRPKGKAQADGKSAATSMGCEHFPDACDPPPSFGRREVQHPLRPTAWNSKRWKSSTSWRERSISASGAVYPQPPAFTG